MFERTSSRIRPIPTPDDGGHVYGCCCCWRLQRRLLLLWPTGTRPVANEKVKSSSTSSRFSTSCCLLDVMLVSRPPRKAAAAKISRSKWRLGLWHVPLWCLTCVHALGTGVHLAMVDHSCLGVMRHTASVEALRGDGLCATRGLNHCKSLALLPALDHVATATARKCRNSSGMTLVFIATRQNARDPCAVESVFRLRSCSPGR